MRELFKGFGRGRVHRRGRRGGFCSRFFGNMESVSNTVVVAHRNHEHELRWEELTTEEKRVVCSTRRKQSLQAQYVYAFIFFITNILAWLFRDYGHKVHSFLPRRVCGTDGNNCVHSGGVLRLSLGCFTFFSFMCVTTFRVHKLHEARNSWHSGWWPLKSVVYLLSIVVPFIAPENIIQIYGEVARIGAGALFGLFLSTIFYVASFVGIILMYYWYAPETTCIVNLFFITWTAILVKVMMIVSLHSKVNMGLLSSAIMGSYIVFLCWSAIQSEPTIKKCNTRQKIAEGNDFATILSFFIAIAAIVMATFSTGTDSHLFQIHRNDAQSEDDIPYKYEKFHFIFAMGSMYFAMLFINWELHQPTKKWSIDVGWASTWVKIVNEWLAASIYLWKLIYPVAVKEESVQSVDGMSV